MYAESGIESVGGYTSQTRLFIYQQGVPKTKITNSIYPILLAMSSCCCCIQKMFLFSFVFYWNGATKTKLVKTHLFFACVSTLTHTQNKRKDRKQDIPSHSEWEKFNVFWLAVHTPTIKKHKINMSCSMCFLSFVLFHSFALAYIFFAPLYLLAPLRSFVIIGLFAHFPNTFIFQMLFDFLSLYHLSSSNANMSKSAVSVALCVRVWVPNTI